MSRSNRSNGVRTFALAASRRREGSCGTYPPFDESDLSLVTCENFSAESRETIASAFRGANGSKTLIAGLRFSEIAHYTGEVLREHGPWPEPESQILVWKNRCTGNARPSVGPSDVRIYAPGWMRECLKIVGKDLRFDEAGVSRCDDAASRQPPFDDAHAGVENSSPSRTLAALYEMRTSTQLRETESIAIKAEDAAAGEEGAVCESYYEYEVDALLELSVAIGLGEIVHNRGAPLSNHWPEPWREPEPVYLCNVFGIESSAGAKFGHFANYSGDRRRGRVHDLVFREVVGERMVGYPDVVEIIAGDELEGNCDENERRYGKYEHRPGLYSDRWAFTKFVARDVVLTGRALNDLAAENDHHVHFKLFRYGVEETYHRPDKPHFRSYLMNALLDGLEELFANHRPERIRSLEFPFRVNAGGLCEARLNAFCSGISADLDLKCFFPAACSDEPKHTIYGAATLLATITRADPHEGTDKEMSCCGLNFAFVVPAALKFTFVEPATSAGRRLKIKFLDPSSRMSV